MTLILYRKPGYETGKILGERLLQAAPHIGVRIKVTGQERRLNLLARRFQRGPLQLMRWGISDNEQVDHLLFRDNVLNEADALKNSTNKLRALRVMAEHGVRCPRAWEDPRNIQCFPVLGRDRYHHGGLDVVKILGSNIPGQNDWTKIPKKDFYVEFIPSNTEYRIHVFIDKVIRVTKKVFRGHNRGGEDVLEPDTIRNDVYGWGHRNIAEENWPKETCDEAIKAVRALGLSFGAVDAIVSSASNLTYILEVNSSPRLNVVGQEVYLKNLCEFLGYDFQREWFGFTDEADDEGGDDFGEDDEEGEE